MSHAGLQIAEGKGGKVEMKTAPTSHCPRLMCNAPIFNDEGKHVSDMRIYTPDDFDMWDKQISKKKEELTEEM
jgi:hypothetical protein